MIIWINGAFGSGKTSVAVELNNRYENSFIYDPENVGLFLRQNEPKHIQTSNFQDEFLWRKINFEMLNNISKHFNGIVIVPMNLINEDYYVEIVGALRKNNTIVHHLVLGASRETLLNRLKFRNEIDPWCAMQINDCIAAYNNVIFENYIDTNNISINEIVSIIINKITKEYVL